LIDFGWRGRPEATNFRVVVFCDVARHLYWLDLVESLAASAVEPR
jgi:hypothetical protein